MYKRQVPQENRVIPVLLVELARLVLQDIQVSVGHLVHQEAREMPVKRAGTVQEDRKDKKERWVPRDSKEILVVLEIAVKLELRG